MREVMTSKPPWESVTSTMVMADIPIGDFLDQPPSQKALFDILFVDLDVEFACVQFVKEQTEGPAGAGFFLDPPASAEAGLAVFVDRRMRDYIVDITLFAACPGGMVHGGLQPCLACGEHACKARKVERLSPDVLDDAPDGLGYLVPADADRGDRVVVVEAELLQDLVRLFDVFDLFENPVEILLQYFLKFHYTPRLIRSFQ